MGAISTAAHGLATLPAWADARLRHIPAFPAAARKLMNLVGSESSNLQLIASILKSDAVLAGETLRIANSALFGLRYEVTSVLHAVSVLGLERLTSVIVTVGLRDLMASPVPEVRRVWRHNLACALAAEQCAPACDVSRANAYTAALLHGIGYVALASCFTEEWRSAVVGANGAQDLLKQEQSLLGFTHNSAAAWLVQYWDLPESLAETSQCGHSGSVQVGEASVAGLVEWACLAAGWAGFPLYDGEVVPDTASLLAQLPRRAAAALEPAMAGMAEQAAYKINDFEQNVLR